MKNLIFALFFLTTYTLSAQSEFKAEVGQGWFFTDAVTSLRGDDKFGGYGWLTTANVYHSTDLTERWYLDYGLGYSHYHFLIFSEENYLPYANLRVAANYRSFLGKTDLTVGITHHVLLFKEERGFRWSRERHFTNLDLGLVFHPGKRWDLKLTTPITIKPMYDLEFSSTDFPGGLSEVRKYRIGVTGLNLGLVFKFGERK